MSAKQAKELIHLDLQNYTKIETGYLLIPIPDEKYKRLPEVYDRVCSIIYFASKIGEKSDRSSITTKALSEAMIRASLCELVAVEDYIASYDRRYKGIWFDSKSNADPIFHMLKLLRNYNVHVDTSTLEKEKMRVKMLYDDKEFTVEKVYISNLHLSILKKVRDSKYYLSVLPQMITVFGEQQRRWGIGSLIVKCTLDNLKKLDGLLKRSGQHMQP